MTRRRSELPHSCISSPARANDETSLLVRWEELPGLELLHGDFRNHAFLPHWHDAYMLAASAGGAQRVRLRGAEHVVTSDVLITLNPGELHDGEAATPAEGWRFRALYLSEELVCDVLRGDSTYRNPVLVTPLQPSSLFADSFLKLHHALRLAPSRLERESLLTCALPRLFSTAVAKASAPKLVGRSPGLERAREYISQEWQTAIPLETLAALAGLSRYYFLRSFSAAYGLPPHAYQLQLRTRHAKELLFAGMAPSEVALATGFYDQAHLTNTLRRYTGATPSRLQLTRQ